MSDNFAQLHLNKTQWRIALSERSSFIFEKMGIKTAMGAPFGNNAVRLEVEKSKKVS